MGTRRLRAGQTIYIVDRKMDFTNLRQGGWCITKYILVEKDPYKLGQCWDFRFPMKHLKFLHEYGHLFFYTSRRKAERKLKELLHYM